MSGEKDKLFREEMAGVTPLNREPRVKAERARRQRDLSLAQRREAAVRGAERDRNTLSSAGIAPLDAWYVLSFKRPGIQHGVFRKLKQGRYDPQARLDLHRMSAERARHEIFEFVEECHDLGLRTVQIVHGKGAAGGRRDTSERASILKGGVDRWLRDLEPVQAFHSAQPHHGGTGAVYVLLRKSEEMKRETRDRFSKGRLPTEG